MLTCEQLDEIETRASKATTGPWTVEDPLTYPSIIADGHKEAYDWDFIAHLETGEAKRSVKADRNAEFIAAARQDVPALIAEVRRLREDRALLEMAVEAIEAWHNIAEHCTISDGMCCCGDDMERHPEPMSCGHSPVDHGAYNADLTLKRTAATIITIKTALEGK